MDDDDCAVWLVVDRHAANSASVSGHKTFAAGPKATTPPSCISARWSAYIPPASGRASPTAVRPWSRRSRATSPSARCCARCRALVAVEQQDRRLGGEARAITSRCCSPPLNCPNRRSANSLVQPPEHVRQRPVVARLGREVADEWCATEQHVLERSHVVRQQRILRHVREERRAPGPRPQRQRDAVDEHVAGVIDESDRGAQQRRLAGAVGTDQPEPATRTEAENDRRPRLP